MLPQGQAQLHQQIAPQRCPHRPMCGYDCSKPAASATNARRTSRKTVRFASPPFRIPRIPHHYPQLHFTSKSASKAVMPTPADALVGRRCFVADDLSSAPSAPMLDRPSGHALSTRHSSEARAPCRTQAASLHHVSQTVMMQCSETHPRRWLTARRTSSLASPPPPPVAPPAAALRPTAVVLLPRTPGARAFAQPGVGGEARECHVIQPR